MPLCGASKEMIHEVLSLSSMIVGGKDAILEIVGSCEFDPIDAVKTVYEMAKPDDGVYVHLVQKGDLVVSLALRLIRTISIMQIQRGQEIVYR